MVSRAISIDYKKGRLHFFIDLYRIEMRALVPECANQSSLCSFEVWQGNDMYADTNRYCEQNLNNEVVQHEKTEELTTLHSKISMRILVLGGMPSPSL